MNETTQGPEAKYVAWRVVPYMKKLGEEGELFTDHDEAVEAAKKLDGDNNWMIEGLTAERYARKVRP